ncbi:phytanoyl-CoA dioxygenase family protein [Flavobacterium sp. CYK-4]|uniref:phytanoyl-CoA dioxygenase family protein n=1 Tax=Flavobacterium lotistagni TaxID=2709660 RepID=UPI00140A77B3|nr:phytanoyl-CoA dioxygenase family protein [Flavobacterium lotistagni]NHM07432.1 phytanoyl-CoA dioxygenase family protein [Flavobacterium lotistagni]
MDLSVLDLPFELTSEQIQFYQENCYIKLKKVLPSEIVDYFNNEISKKVAALSAHVAPIEQRNTYGKAFLQLFNLWENSDVIQKLVFSKRLAKIAADLMQTQGVRLYHDQALFKEVGGGITPWHADQHYWPLSSDKTITVWIPLQATLLAMGPLEFAAKSQSILAGRELSISDESENQIKEYLRINDFEHVIEPFDLGEVSFHSGWIFHRAGANASDQTRKVMTVIYMDKDMRLKAPSNSGQHNDWKTWCPGAEIDQVINTPLNPILYQR